MHWRQKVKNYFNLWMIADIIGIVMHFLFLSFSILVVCLHFFSCFFTFLLAIIFFDYISFLFLLFSFLYNEKKYKPQKLTVFGSKQVEWFQCFVVHLDGMYINDITTFSALGGVEGVAKWWLHEKKLILSKIDDKKC